MSHGGCGLLNAEKSVGDCNMNRGLHHNQNGIFGYDAASFCMRIAPLCAEIARQNPFGGAKCPRTTRDNPPKPLWRGKMSKGNKR